MTTVRELSDALGVSPQAIRNFAKSSLNVATKPRQTLQFDANQASVISAHFSGKIQKAAKIAANNFANDDAQTLQNCATLTERVAGLERENEGLREQVEFLRSQIEFKDDQIRAATLPWWRKLGSGKRD